MILKEMMRKTGLAIVSGLFAIGATFQKKQETNPMLSQKTAGKVYEFEMKTIDGKMKKLSDYKGHPLLIVNTASLCGFTPQYQDLEDLFKKYESKGLKIAAFPANEFGAQEPGSDSEIKKFCMTKYSVSFDLYSKIVVKGNDTHPLYKYLTTESGYPGDIPWNFTKFLVDKNGKVVGRFGPDINPMGKEITHQLDTLF